MTNEELAKLIAEHECNITYGTPNCKICPFLYCGACTLRVVSGWVKTGTEKFNEEKKAADGILNFKCGAHSCDDCAFHANSILMVNREHTSCIKDFLKFKIEQKEKKYGNNNEDSGSEGHGNRENDKRDVLTDLH